jgi:UDP-2-acetamido-3-amino-2,3-dideoxy-glucuronate N-acetyltransferase
MKRPKMKLWRRSKPLWGGENSGEIQYLLMSNNVNERNLALIGAGYWGKNLARNFQELGALHTICDASEATLQKFAEMYEGLQTATDVADVFANDAINRVAIAAPAEMHYGLAKAALEAGKDVYVEKPLCLDLDEAFELQELAQAKGRVLMVGHLLQYHACIEKIQALVAQGELGRLHYISSNRLNLGKIRKEENALWSFAPHDLSVILSLVGKELPSQVRCVGGSYLTEGVADTTLMSMGFDSGIRAHVYVSWLNPFKEQKLTVVGSHGMIVFDDTLPWGEKLLLYRQHLTWADGQVPTPNKKEGECVDPEQQEPLRQECQHFIDCCDQRSEPKTDGAEGIRVLQLLQAAQASLDDNGEAVVKDGPDGILSTRRPGKAGVQSAGFVHPSAAVDDDVVIGAGSKVWHFSHVCSGVRIGECSNFGQNTMIGNDVVVGNNVKVQNNVSIYQGVTIEDDVFLGPSCVLTNVTNPRSQVNRHRLYEKTRIRRGATVGANATIVCGITLGRYSFVAAGALVAKDVRDYALMVGAPARQVGWMSRHGHRLEAAVDEIMTCPESGLRYREADGVLKCLDLDEEAALPDGMRVGEKTYDDFK